MAGGTHTLQERYAKSIVALKRKENVVRNLFRTDYIGDPTAGAIQIPNRATEVTVADYNINTGVALTTSATTYTKVTVSQDKAINELIDGFEAKAVPDNLVAQRIDSGAYSMGRTQELHSLSILQENATVTAVATATAADSTYSTILTDVKTIKKLGVPIGDIKIVISDDIWQKLLTDTKFSNTASVIGADLIRNGVVSKIGGAEVYTSSNMYEDEDEGAGQTGKDVTTEWIVFSPLWAQKCEDWKVLPAVRDLMDGKHVGSSALQGRMVYQDALLDSTTARAHVVAVTQT